MPLPSSPHWAPTTTMPGMPCRESRTAAVSPPGGTRAGGRRRRAGSGSPQISMIRETVRSPICSRELLGVEVRRDDERALVLVALVDDRVELLEHPVGRCSRRRGRRGAAGRRVVELVEQLERARPRCRIVSRMSSSSRGQRVDRDRAARPRSPPCETSIASVVLPVPTSPTNQMPRPSSRLLLDVARVAADLGARPASGIVGDREAVERDVAVALGQPRLEPARLRAADAQRPAAAVASRCSSPRR